jgi:DNA-binding response OmpR family regulator
MRLLIVEDDTDVRDLLIEVCEDEGYDADGAGSVASATAALRTRQYDLVVLDLWLPDGSGTAVLRALRQVGSAVPVVVCSGRPDAVLRTRMFEAGADAVLEKPFSCNEMIARVRALLRRPQVATDVLTADQSAGSL